MCQNNMQLIAWEILRGKQCALYFLTSVVYYVDFTNLWKSPWFPVGTPVACVVTIAINVLNEW